MSSRQLLSASLSIAVAGTVVLAGWVLDLAIVTSLRDGWRVMVPSSAATFVLVGVVLALESWRLRRYAAWQTPAIVVLAGALLVIPALTLFEHAAGVRTGVEHWLGFTFTGDVALAGRMAPLTSLCFAVLAFAIAALPLRGPNASRFVRTASGAILMVSWLAVLAMSFDTSRLQDAPRFPGMAVPTILLMAASSATTLALSMQHSRLRLTDAVQGHPAFILLAGFLAPIGWGWVQMRVADRGWRDSGLVSAIGAFAFGLLIAGIVWRYTARMAELHRDRERAFAELEARVAERTRDLEVSNEQLRAREDSLRDADRRKDDFLATLAHELRNPLAPIRNAAGLLRAGNAAPADQQEAVIIIERQVALMVRLIDDLLDVSRITAGKLPLRRACVEIGEVLEQAIVSSRPHVVQAGHRLVVTPLSQRVFVDGDFERLSQVFANLLHNACKYTEPGGIITITLTMPEASHVEVSILDNGIGIPGAFVPRLFEKFSQVAPALDRSQGGLGLGLSLVHGIVTLHDGEVSARSDGAGRGSEFVVRLPTVAAPEASLDAAPATAAPAGISRRILVVDDNEDSAESLAILLRMHGHLVHTAHDGEAALVMAGQFRPDVILLDLGMPKLNGYEVCRRIRQAPWSNDTLIVAQTGWGQEQDRARTKAAGFDGHLTKPIDPAMWADLLTAGRLPSTDQRVGRQSV